MRTKNTTERKSLGELIDELSIANINIYFYENKTWWGRDEGATLEEISEWDHQSRVWNEVRSRLKNEIDAFLTQSVKHKIASPNSSKNNSSSGYPFQVLPISLMIDMLSIENIKIFDLTKKKQPDKVKKAEARKIALKKTIDQAIAHIHALGSYELEPETRTF